MGSLAGLLKAAGYEVSGSDAHTYPPMSEQLRAGGIKVYEGYDPAQVPQDADLVIIGNAVSKDHPEVVAVEEKGLPTLSMADAVAKFFLQKKRSIVVAGTHGKTTTSALLAWLLTAAGRDPSFLIGGILKNFDRSWQLGQGEDFVVEGDEYDTAFFDKTPKFLHYEPRWAILNPIEFDHADIYPDLQAVLKAFAKFLQQLPIQGRLFACGDNDNVRQLLSHARCPVLTFGNRAGLDYQCLSVATTPQATKMTFRDPEGKTHQLMSPMAGGHNATNLLGVYALLRERGVTLTEVQTGLTHFVGIKRRQEVKGVVGDITVIDDFAHHPTAVKETLQALRGRYPQARLWAIFEPRSNTSRTRVFQDQWAEAFSIADKVVLAPPYDNGKIPREQLLDVDRVVGQIKDYQRSACALKDVTEIVRFVGEKAKPHDVIACLSNGGFDDIHNKLLRRLEDNA